MLRGGEEFAYCETDLDCDQNNLCAIEACIDNACIPSPPVLCESPDSCHSATCNPETGSCDLTPLTFDVDRDGHLGPLPGFLPGEEGACGDDCDDTSALAYPGGAEVCDGVDNDCDGVVDNGTEYLAALRGTTPSLTQLAPNYDGSGSRGIAYGEGVFAMSYWGRTDVTQAYIHGYNTSGEEVFPSTNVSKVNAPSFGADLAWSGEAFGALWADPRVDDNYELYFARFDSAGQKLGPDLRITNADDFSIHGRVLYDQGQYVMVWDDWRNEEVGESSQVYAQLVSSSGELSAGNIKLTQELGSAEKPYLSATARRFGVAYTMLENSDMHLKFKTFDKSFGDASPALTLQDSGITAPRTVALGEHFLVTWSLYVDVPGNTIMGAVVDGAGQLIIPPTPLTSGAMFARGHHTVSLGDRFLLFWIDDQDGNYELYAKVIGADLSELESRVRLTEDMSDTDNPAATLGDNGRVGVIFDDWRGGERDSYFLSAGCGTPSSTN